jgi:hypothetical protein
MFQLQKYKRIEDMKKCYKPKQETRVKQVGLLDLFFDSEDGGNMFLQNIS